MFVAGGNRDILSGFKPLLAHASTYLSHDLPPTPLMLSKLLPSLILRRDSMRLPVTLALALGIFCVHAAPTPLGAQGVNVLTAKQEPTEPKPKKAKPTLQERQAEVAKRLEELAAEVEAAKQNEAEPPRSASREFKTLMSVNTLLTESISEQVEVAKLQAERQALREQLEELIQSGLDAEFDTSFRRLDEIRKELQSDRRRLKRSSTEAERATAALDTAENELRKLSSARRLAKEKFDDNTEDELRQTLGEKLAKARDEEEIAVATLELRKLEAANAKASNAIQELNVELLEETDKRLRNVTKFGTEQLNEILQEIDRQEDKLQRRLTESENAAQLRIRDVEEQWIRARRAAESTDGDKAAIEERVKAFELKYRILRNVPSILRPQIERFEENRKVWRLRQRNFLARPKGSLVNNWTDGAKDALTQLKREEGKELFEIDEFEERLSEVRKRLQQAEKRSLAATELNRQVGSLRELLGYHEENLGSIRNSIWLQQSLLDELTSDSLATTASDHLHSIWDGVQAVWHYELTTFGEEGAEKAVTVQKVVTALLVLFAGLIFSKALSRALGNQVLRRIDIDPSASATIQSLFYYVLLLIFSLFALNVAKVPLTAFTVLGGAVALGIGFGSQNIINNFISGLILLAERPVKVGDLIQLDQANGEQLYGNIEHIGARSTRVRTGSNLEIIVPNSSFLQNNVVNFTLSSDKVRTKVEVGVVYGSPTVSVTQLLRRAVIETGRVAKDPPPIILFKNFGDDSLVFEVHFWLRMRTMMDQMQIESAVRFRIDQLFREAGIVIAFPQRDVHLDATAPIPVQMVEPTTESI